MAVWCVFSESFVERSTRLADIKTVSYTHLDVYKRQVERYTGLFRTYGQISNQLALVTSGQYDKLYSGGNHLIKGLPVWPI